MRIVPESPTVTNNPVVVELSVLVVLSLLLQEMKEKLKRSKERMMSRCFNWFPISGFRRTQVIPELDVDYNVCVGFDLRICLVGVIILFLVVVW